MANEKYKSTKLIDGFSTCFRQWKAKGTHCSLLHGYAISFNVTFEGELDDRNWVVDFGFLKRSKTKMHAQRAGVAGLVPDEWFKHMFDHTVVLAADDPNLNDFEVLDDDGVLELRVLPQVGCEMFAKYVYDELNKFLYVETEDRVRCISVECFEHAKNSAVYGI